MQKILVLLICFFSLAAIASAEFYRWQDAEGNTVFSDRPPAGHKKSDDKKVNKEELPAINTTPSLEIPLSVSQSELSPEEQEYSSLMITSPLNDVEVRENAGNVTITVKVDPEEMFYNSTDLIAIYMNGEEISRGKNTSVSLQNIDRGTHTISAEVISSNGRTLIQAEPSIFHLKRFRIAN